MPRSLCSVLMLASVVGVAAQGARQEPQGTGRISGRVVTSYGALVADATVTLTRLSPEGFRRSLQSGPKGEFSFDRLPAGRYGLSASRSGLTSRRLPAAEPAETPGSAVTLRSTMMVFESGRAVALDEGQQLADVEVELIRSSRIAGRIIRPDGTPAPDVTVTAARRSGGRLLPLLETRTTSAWDGRYEVADLPPGDYLVVAQSGLRRTGTSPDSFPATLYPGVPDTEPGQPVTVLEGVPVEGIDIWLTPANRFTVSGRVIWPVGVAPRTISIDYGDPAGTRAGMWDVSDPGGAFTLGSIPPGPLALLARVETDQGPLLGLASTVVAIDSVEDVAIIVDRPGTVHGRLSYEPGITPPEGVTVRLVQMVLRLSAIYPAPEAPVARDGRFTLSEALGEYEVEVLGLPPGLTVSHVQRNGRPLPDNRFAVAGGEVVDGVEVGIRGRSEKCEV